MDTETIEWTPPESLSAPSGASGNPSTGYLIAAGLSVLVGGALFLAGLLPFWIYIFYNLVVGRVIAKGLSKSAHAGAPKTTLLVVGAVLAIVPYVIFYCANAVVIGVSPVDYIQAYLVNQTIFGASLGVVGNLAIMLAEVGITFYAIYAAVNVAVQHAKVASVPRDVLAFVLNALNANWETSRIRGELSRHGWVNPVDQDRAIGGAYEIIQAHQNQ